MTPERVKHRGCHAKRENLLGDVKNNLDYGFSTDQRFDNQKRRRADDHRKKRRKQKDRCDERNVHDRHGGSADVHLHRAQLGNERESQDYDEPVD